MITQSCLLNFSSQRLFICSVIRLCGFLLTQGLANLTSSILSMQVLQAIVNFLTCKYNVELVGPK